MQKIISILSGICLLYSGIAAAQTGKITGKLETSDTKPAEAIVISLLSANDNTLVKTQLSEPDGSFAFDALPMNNFVVVVEDVGYQLFRSEPIALTIEQPEVTIPTFVLQPAEANKIDAVIVKNRKSFVEHKIDKTVVNVDAMISSAGADAMDVLEKSPGITVDSNGTITFKGKSGVTVFIDDKPTYLSGSELEIYLKSLPASTLDQIEFMTNPPAKYDAAGSAGVINIKTKRSKAKGFNGSVTSRVSRGKGTHTRNGINLNYKDQNISIFGNAGYATQEFVSDLYIFRRYKNEDETTKTLFDQNTLMDRKLNTANARVGMDYYASDKTTFGLSLSGLTKRSTDVSDGKSVLTNGLGVLDSTIVANNYVKNDFRNGSINLNLRHQFDTIGRKLTADFDYLKYSNKTQQRFKNFIYQPDNSLSDQDELLGDLPSDIAIYSFKTDYIRPMKDNAVFETGYKISYSKTDNIADYADVINGIPVPNYDNSNHFKYDEVINAVYVNYNKSYKRFSFQSGLRLENTVSEGNQLGNDLKEGSKFKKTYTNLFPTLYVQYKLDSIGDNSLVLSYGKRITRPYYQDLNPFISPLDKFTYYEGNPYLNPAFTHNVEFSYSFKSLFATTFSYSKTKDNIDETIEITNGKYYSRPGNIGKSQIISLNVTSDVPLTDWLSANVYSEITHTAYRSKLYTQTLDTQGTYWFMMAMARIKLGSGWSGELSGRYITAMESSQFTTGDQGAINFAVQKKVLGNRGSLKFSVNDLFYTNTNRGTINNLRLTDATYNNKGDTRFAALTFTYGFGKTFESKDKHQATGAQSEQNRVKE